MKYLKRIVYIPLGIWEGVKAFLNRHARDVENRRRFPKAIIDKGATFTSDVTIGEGSHVLSGCTVNHSCIGFYTYIGRNSLLQNVTVGNYCSIAHEVNMGLGRHPIDLMTTSPLFYRKQNTFRRTLVDKDLDFEEYAPINLGHDVWVGARALIMDGVTVGTGAIVAAGAVVTKDVPPYAIVGGVPAKIIKYRFPEVERERLLKSEWWNLAPEAALKMMKKDIYFK
ncbi:CatB-related O-acetyltransferase [Pseudozobellia thermophila]|uniref:Acetyltransferase (Isoleucine patch superfamily) n=1 Tax=Pseudozobellia thermophila TaxID=192903 RepID=A0A1M6KQQ9_9FLAO|nr:DapH/DapD/GlmU-related protein [Pseudozobellia thermophila]SHJ61279.1 Acetyltransferase (isoleucine patch superfamily) [Pseudozobellia thermophila]